MTNSIQGSGSDPFNVNFPNQPTTTQATGSSSSSQAQQPTDTVVRLGETVFVPLNIDPSAPTLPSDFPSLSEVFDAINKAISYAKQTQHYVEEQNALSSKGLQLALAVQAFGLFPIIAAIALSAQAAVDIQTQEKSNVKNLNQQISDYNTGVPNDQAQTQDVNGAMANLIQINNVYGPRIEADKVNVAQKQTDLINAQNQYNQAQATVTLDNELLAEAQNAEAQAQAAYDQAQAQLTQAQNTVNQDQSAVSAAQTAYNQAQAQLNSAQTALNNAQTQFNQAQGAFNQAQTAFNQASNTLDQANQLLENDTNTLNQDTDKLNQDTDKLNQDIQTLQQDQQAQWAARNEVFGATVLAQLHIISLADLGSLEIQLTNAQNAAQLDLANGDADAYAKDSALVTELTLQIQGSAYQLDHGIITQDQYDAIQANYNNIQATVSADQDAVTADQDQVNADQDQLNADQTTVFADQAFVSKCQKAYDSAKATLDTAQANLNTAQSNLNTAQASFNTAQSNLNAAQNTLSAAQSKLAADQAAVTQAQNNVTSALNNLNAAKSAVTAAQNADNIAIANLNTAKINVDKAQAAYDNAVAQLNADVAFLNAAETAYNNAIQSYNNYIIQRNVLITAMEGNIDSFNTAVDASNQATDALNAQRAKMSPPLPPMPKQEKPIFNPTTIPLMPPAPSAPPIPTLATMLPPRTLLTAVIPPIVPVPSVGQMVDIFFSPVFTEFQTAFLFSRNQDDIQSAAQEYASYYLKGKNPFILPAFISLNPLVSISGASQGVGGDNVLSTLDDRLTTKAVNDSIFKAAMESAQLPEYANLKDTLKMSLMHILLDSGLNSAMPALQILASQFSQLDPNSDAIKAAVSLSFTSNILNLVNSDAISSSIAKVLGGISPELQALQTSNPDAFNNLVAQLSAGFNLTLLDTALTQISIAFGLPGLIPQILANTTGVQTIDAQLAVSPGARLGDILKNPLSLSSVKADLSKALVSTLGYSGPEAEFLANGVLNAALSASGPNVSVSDLKGAISSVLQNKGLDALTVRKFANLTVDLLKAEAPPLGVVNPLFLDTAFNTASFNQNQTAIRQTLSTGLASRNIKLDDTQIANALNSLQNVQFTSNRDFRNALASALQTATQNQLDRTTALSLANQAVVANDGTSLGAIQTASLNLDVLKASLFKALSSEDNTNAVDIASSITSSLLSTPSFADEALLRNSIRDSLVKQNIGPSAANDIALAVVLQSNGGSTTNPLQDFGLATVLSPASLADQLKSYATQKFEPEAKNEVATHLADLAAALLLGPSYANEKIAAELANPLSVLSARNEQIETIKKLSGDKVVQDIVERVRDNAVLNLNLAEQLRNTISPAHLILHSFGVSIQDYGPHSLKDMPPLQILV